MGLSGQRVRPKIWRVTLGEGEQILSVLRWYKVVDTCLRRRGCGYMKSEDWRERVSLGNHFVGCRQRTFWLSEGAWLWAGKFPISLYFPFIANNTIYLPLWDTYSDIFHYCIFWFLTVGSSHDMIYDLKTNEIRVCFINFKELPNTSFLKTATLQLLICFGGCLTISILVVALL